MAERRSKNKKIRLAAIAAALSTGGIVIALMPSANAAQPKSGCELPSENKCLVITNHASEVKLPDGTISKKAIKSIKVQVNIPGEVTSTIQDVTKCFNIPLNKRLYLFRDSDFLRKVSPDDLLTFQGWDQPNCVGDQRVPPFSKSKFVPTWEEGRRSFWIDLRQTSIP